MCSILIIFKRLKKENKTKAFKVFNQDWTCRGFEYKVGKTYAMKETPELCKRGFHACEKVVDCFGYYSFDPKNKVAEVKLMGKIVCDGDKLVCNKIKIVREISWEEMLTLANAGSYNSGYRNSGDRNSGDRNSGNRNSGYYNSGNYNSGDYNSGYCNSGDYNSGDYNSGDYNSGYYNSGNYNSGNRNSGMFNTNEPKARMFNKPCNYTMSEMIEKGIIPNMYACFLTEWVKEENMTNKEKIENPKFYTTGGYLKKYTYKEAWQNYWENTNTENKQKIIKLPNFDAKIFEEITGIKV